MNLNDFEYFYIRNTQGDIIGLIDDKGDEVVKYTYDSWGKLISIKDKDDINVTNDKTHVGYKNPYRYRGYRYDTEIGLYYLQRRYCNPEWGRFVNGDVMYEGNLFTYCDNDPINKFDPKGYISVPVDYDNTMTGLEFTPIRTQKNTLAETVLDFTGTTTGQVVTGISKAVVEYKLGQQISKAVRESYKVIFKKKRIDKWVIGLYVGILMAGIPFLFAFIFEDYFAQSYIYQDFFLGLGTIIIFSVYLFGMIYIYISTKENIEVLFLYYLQ